MNNNLRLAAAVALAILGGALFYTFTRPPTPPQETQPQSTATLPRQTGEPLCQVAAPKAGGWLIEGVVGKPSRINPLLSDLNPVDADLVDLIFDGLTEIDDHGQLTGALADSWEISPDGLTVTFSLREEARWHDGEPVTVQDVAFTYGLLQSDLFPAPETLKLSWRDVAITPLDERRISFTLPAPYAPFLEATRRGILPAHLLANVPPDQLADHPFNFNPVGAGPFKTRNEDEWLQSGSLALTPNLDYWANGTLLDGIIFRFYPDDEAVLAAQSAGDIDSVNFIDPENLPAFSAAPDISLYTALQNRYSQLIFNLTDDQSPVADKLVREALAFGLDVNALLPKVRNGQGVPFAGPFLRTNWAYDPAISIPYPTHPISATQKLQEAGFSLPLNDAEEAVADGIWQKDDQPLLLSLISLDDELNVNLAESIADQWRLIGVETEAIPLAPAQFQEALNARAFDVALVDVVALGDPDLYDLWSQEAVVRGQNYGGWNHRAASEALEQARQSWEMAARQKAYDLFQYYFQQDLPAISLFQHTRTYALSSTIFNADVGVFFRPRQRYAGFDRWHLEQDMVQIPCSETP